MAANARRHLYNSPSSVLAPDLIDSACVPAAVRFTNAIYDPALVVRSFYQRVKAFYRLPGSGLFGKFVEK